MSQLADVIRSLQGGQPLTAENALTVRRAVYGDGAVSLAEAQGLIALDEAAQSRETAWDDLFVEALTDILVHQQQPAGYIDAAQADWLMGALSRDGRIKTDSELELLVKILETATEVPKRLVTFALDQVKAAVINGSGPLLRGGEVEPGKITAGEVGLLRRVLYAQAGDDDLAITRAEAEILFDINDACRGGANDPSWTDLFSRAIAASVMTVSGYEPPARADAARREAWLAAPEGGATGVADLLWKTLKSVGRAPVGELRKPTDGLEDWRAHNALNTGRIAAAETVDGTEAQWLAERIGRDGVFDVAERAVIDFLRRESPKIHPALQPLLEA